MRSHIRSRCSLMMLGALLAVLTAFTLCALAVPPGSSLPKEDSPLAQIVTLFTLTDARMEGEQYFVSGKGYAEIDGGGRFFAGMNRKLDPYLEVTIVPVNTRALARCRKLLETQ